MFLKVKDLGKAIRYIDEAIDPDTKDTDFFHIKGSILEELNRYDEALQVYEKALEIEPKNVKIRYSLGNVLEKSGRRTRAMDEMEKILVEKPDDASALNFIGYTLAVAGKDLARAERLVRQAATLKPDDGYIMDSLGWILFKTGRTDEALEHLEKAADKVKTDPIVAEHLGDILLAKDKKQDALEAYRRSLQVNPENMVIQEKLQKLEQDIQVEKK
jgi:tetratricopeptide (TPR) repeat protein